MAEPKNPDLQSIRYSRPTDVDRGIAIPVRDGLTEWATQHGYALDFTPKPNAVRARSEHIRKKLVAKRVLPATSAQAPSQSRARGIENRLGPPPQKTVNLPGLGMVGGGSNRTTPMGKGGRGGGGKGGKVNLRKSGYFREFFKKGGEGARKFTSWLKADHIDEEHEHVNEGGNKTEARIREFAEEEGKGEINPEKLKGRSRSGSGETGGNETNERVGAIVRPSGLTWDEALAGVEEYGGIWAIKGGHQGYLVANAAGKSTWTDIIPEGAPVIALPGTLSPIPNLGILSRPIIELFSVPEFSVPEFFPAF